MQLDDTQKQQVSQWITEGLELSDIQQRLGDEFGIHLTYMEVRFLVDDLGLQVKDRESENEEPKEAGSGSLPAADTELVDEDRESSGTPGKVQVSIDQITRPGSVVSGHATFSDGKRAEWHLDQMGRMGLIPEEEGYKPPEDDVMEFQVQLQNLLRKSGF